MWYRVELVLGRGGFAVTYLVEDQHLKQRFAIKEYLPTGLTQRDGTEALARPGCEKDFIWGRERFLAEAQTLARFKHRNIVRVVSFFEANNTAYLVMDYEEGESLAQYLPDHPALSESAVLAIMLPLIEGLEVLHRDGFIHRDIKPENIYLRKDGTPVLLDFGSARQALGGQTQNLTALLSPGYAPLEQYFSQKDRQGPWSDIYALGAVMYRIISGHKPAEASLRSSYQINKLPDPLKPAMQIGLGKYSQGLLTAIDNSLRLREADRPQSLTEWRGMITGQSHAPAGAWRAAADNTVVLPASPHALSHASPDATTTRRRTIAPIVEPESGSGKRWFFGLAAIIALGVAYKATRPPVEEKPASIRPASAAAVAAALPVVKAVVQPDPPAQNTPLPKADDAVEKLAMPQAEPADHKMRVCRADIERYCFNLVPGDGRFGACMRDNAYRLSPECRLATSGPQRPHLPRN